MSEPLRVGQAQPNEPQYREDADPISGFTNLFKRGDTVSIQVKSQPQVISSQENFTVNISLPPAKCHRCGALVGSRVRLVDPHASRDNEGNPITAYYIVCAEECKS